MFIEWKSLVRSLRKRRQVLLELNTTETAKELRKKSTMRRRPASFRKFFDSQPNELSFHQSVTKTKKPIDQTVYVNVPQRCDSENSCSTSMACSQFSESNGNTLFDDDLKPAIYNKKRDLSLSDGSEIDAGTCVDVGHTTFKSFAIDPSEIFEDEPSLIPLESEKMVSQFFGSTLESIETSVQSSLEAYNEYIRLKHTIRILQKIVAQKDAFFIEGPTGMLRSYMNGLINSLENTMDKLEEQYPRLHEYAHKKGAKKMTLRRIDENDEGEDLVEFQVL
uniref:KxDL domain-containing protein n=2 Tax=Bursaphelenchus xylophilus TaxID=6326 RepID=A0A1I7SW35_BURXY